MLTNRLIFIITLLIKQVVGDYVYKSSLTFVIDDTASMGDDIHAVILGADAIFDTVLRNHASQIENFILVTFNDLGNGNKGVTTRAKTKDRAVFKEQLHGIRVHGGGDCPEYAMSGIKQALEQSMPGSYLYVFTDATAKDYAMYEEVQSIAQSKQCQVVFVLTGQCNKPDTAEDYQVYHSIAKVTDGQVFNVEKQEVKIILEFVKNSIRGRTTTMYRSTLPAGTHNFTFEADPKMKDTTLTLASGKAINPSVDVTAPDGSKTSKKILFETAKNKVYSIDVTKTGPHTVKVATGSETRTLLTATSTVNFKHGFSSFVPRTIADTSSKPAPDVKSHLSIKLVEGDIDLISAKVLDMYDNEIMELPLGVIDKAGKFFVTEPFDSPKTMFRIAIIGYDPESKTNITRMASTPVEPQKIIPGEKIDNKIPTVVIEGEAKVNAEYDAPLQLICKVNAYPKPIIVWKNKEKGTIMPSEMSIRELPYDHISVLNIKNVIENATYKCEANNPVGSNDREVAVETIRRRYFYVLHTPRRIEVEFEKEGKISCLVDAYPPPQVYWFKNGRQLNSGANYEISRNTSILTIKHTTLSDKGKYICEVRNEDTRRIFTKYVTVVGVERPVIDKRLSLIFVKKGFTAVIECKVLKGRPKPRISWSFASGAASEELKPKPEWDGRERVVVTNAGKHDNGVYQCSAENEISTDYHDFDLVVEYPPTIAKDVKFINAAIGSEVTISCNVDGGPTPLVTWLKDGMKITSRDDIHIFGNQTLGFVAKPSDIGYYTCRATNPSGTVEKTTKVDIHVPVTIVPPKESNLAVLVGSDLMLPCKAKGDPRPDIKWLFHNFDTSAPSRKTVESKMSKGLLLEHIQVKEEGFYTCVASNSGGSTNITYKVQVFAPPIIENTYKDKRFTAVEGDLALRITCKASGNPKPTITWTKDGWNLALGSTFYVEHGTLVIRNVPRDASGVYKCEAENPRGVAREIYEVTVDKYPPPGRVSSSILIEEGKPTEITCDIPHNKLDQLRWYKNGIMIRFGKLILNNPALRDTGIYTCRVSDFFKSTSGHVRATVGRKPEFTTKEDEDIEMVEGPPVRLTCEASGIPKPNFVWYHNGEVLNSTEPVFYFPTGVTSPGQYKCEATNVFGTISRTFTATPRDCFVNTKKLTNLQPLMVTSSLTWPIFERSKEFLVFPKGEQFVLFCPHKFKTFPQQYLMAFCDGGMNIKVNGKKYDYSDIQCTEEVTHVVKRTGKYCMPGDTELIKIVYKVVDRENAEVYEICLDKTNNVPLYAKHSMQSSLADDDYKTTWSDGDQFSVNFDELYDCKNQINGISNWLGKRFRESDECCFSKRQLVNPRDVFPGVAQRSTLSYFNVVPHWSTCNAENWDDIEQKVRHFAKNSYSDILVWTGTAKELSLQRAYGDETNSFFRDNKWNYQPVPQFMWKVIQDPASRSSLAIIQVNVPDLSPPEVSRYVLCRDICNYSDWMKGSKWHDVKRGYTYCCSIQEFERAFGFDGVFEPDMTAILTADAYLLPESSLTIL